MIRRTPLARTLFAILAVAILAGPALGQTEDGAKARQVRRNLQELMSTKKFSNQEQLRTALLTLEEEHNLKVLVDVSAFRNDDPDAPSPFECTVQLPPTQIRMHTALRMMVDQLPQRATFLVHDGWIEIVPVSAALSKALLQKRVVAEYDAVPFKDVLDDLSAKTGAPIVLDARAQDKGKELVSLALNNLSLEDALLVLTRQAGLRCEVLETSLFVTPRAEGRQIDRKPEK